MNFKKLLRKIKREGLSKRVISAAAAIILIVGILGYKFLIASAYPTSWDRYDHAGSGIYNTIYNSQKTTMDKYDSAASYTIVHTPADSYIDPYGNTFYYAHGKNYEYTNTTIDDTNKWKSKWYLSGYGPYLNYAVNNSPESTSIQFSDDRTNSAYRNLYNNSDHVYVASTAESLADAKSLASYAYTKNIDSLAPLLINSDSTTLSSSIVNEITSHNKKNIVILGGGQRYDTLFAIGQQFNLVRVGGNNRNDTYNLLTIAESNSSGIYNITTPPNIDASGVICDIKSNLIPPDKKLKVNNYLKASPPDFDAAAKLLLENLQYGIPQNINATDYQVLIGCKDPSSGRSKFLKVYYLKTQSVDTNSYQYGVYQYIGSDYFNSTPTTPPTPTPGSGPTATVSAPSQVVAGNDVTITGTGTSNDSSVSSLTGQLSVNGTGVNVISLATTTTNYTDPTQVPHATSFMGSVWFSQEGSYQAYSTVKDNNMLTGVSSPTTIQVRPPIPSVSIQKSGAEKVNRKIVIDASGSSGGSQRYGLDWTKATWNVTALSGGINTNNDIRIQTHTQGSVNGQILVDSSRGINQSIAGLKTFDVQFKQAGQYQVQCTLWNTYGKSSTVQMVINILPDAPQITNFSLPTNGIRDPNNNMQNGFAAYNEIATDNESQTDGSYSTDGDYIQQRAWLIAFDANNNHTYTDDKWFLYDTNYTAGPVDNPHLRLIGDYNTAKSLDIRTMNIGNPKSVTFKVSHSGAYGVALISEEGFGQEYIPQFVVPQDYNQTDNFD